MAGRNTKLNEDTQSIVIDAVEAGMYDKEAAALAGIHPETFINWRDRGKKEKSGIYFEFFEALKKAQYRGKLKRIKEVVAAGENDWRAAMTWLERKYPQEWGRFERIGLTDPTGEHGARLEITSKDVGSRVRRMVEEALSSTRSNGK